MDDETDRQMERVVFERATTLDLLIHIVSLPITLASATFGLLYLIFWSVLAKHLREHDAELPREIPRELIDDAFRVVEN